MKTLYDQPQVCNNLDASRLNWLISAEVIKVEHPTRGDDTRAWGPPYAEYTEESGKQGLGESAYFLSVKDSLVLISMPDLTGAGQSQQEINWTLIPNSCGSGYSPSTG